MAFGKICLMKPRFQNRIDAGKKLAKKLKDLKLEKPLVVGLVNGGVVVAAEVARALSAPLHALPVAKIHFPDETSLGFGAVSKEHEVCLPKYTEGIPEEIISRQTSMAKKKLTTKLRLIQDFILPNSPNPLKSQTVLLVDDSLATGASMMAAILQIKQLKPKGLIIAAPAASEQAINLLKSEADEIVTLYQHPEDSFERISVVYKDYEKVGDREVVKIIKNWSN